MKEAQILELLPNGLTKVDLRNETRKEFLFPKGFLDNLARECGCKCERCRAESASNSTAEAPMKWLRDFDWVEFLLCGAIGLMVFLEFGVFS